VPLLLLVAWVAGLVYLGALVGFWRGELATGTVLWLMTTGLVIFGNFDDATKKRDFFRRKALATLEGVLVRGCRQRRDVQVANPVRRKLTVDEAPPSSRSAPLPLLRNMSSPA
jgi:hypothetical protein